MWDREAGVGGMIHLLLPHAPFMDEISQPERYASTGMPLFTQALCEAGAKASRMEASVAGGALVGPVSTQDLRLDIGGQIMDVVEIYLKLDKIPVTKLETGGYLGCCLQLNLANGNCQILPAAVSPKRSNQANGREEAEQVRLDPSRISSIPQIALKILRILEEKFYSIDDLAAQVRQDQVLSLKVLNYCNSAAVSPRDQVDSLDRALVILGEKEFLNIALSMAMQNFFQQSERGYSLAKGSLYRHAVGTAKVAERLAVFTGKASPKSAYMAGLVHDVGKVALDQFVADRYPLFYRKTQAEGEFLLDAELQTMGMDHTQAGTMLAEHWRLPANLRDVIAHHHRPDQAQCDPDLVFLVHLADQLMSRFALGREIGCLDYGLTSDHLERLGLSNSQFAEVVDLMPQVVFGL
jgi:putative nucleotidyltransferase with HDIG domain